MKQQQRTLEKSKVIADMNMRRADYERTFSTEWGKRVLEDLKVSAYFKKTSFSSDTHVMSFNEGARTIVLHIENMSTPKPKDSPKAKAIKEGDTNE